MGKPPIHLPKEAWLGFSGGSGERGGGAMVERGDERRSIFHRERYTREDGGTFVDQRRHIWQAFTTTRTTRWAACRPCGYRGIPYVPQ